MSPSLSIRKKLNRIYKDICGFEIPISDEKRVRASKGSPLYGEINHQALTKLFDYLNLKPHDVLYDLGSGVGKVVLHAVLTTKVKKAYGVELSSARHNEALIAYQRAQELDPRTAGRCEFLNCDLLTIDLHDATTIYTCSTAFSEPFMKKLVALLATIPGPLTVVSLQSLPECRQFKEIQRLALDMSWVRKTSVHVYEKVPLSLTER